MNNTYPKGTVFQLLLKGSEAARVVEEWWDTTARADLRVRKAKTKGHTVIETEDMMFTSHVLNWWPGTKINIKEPK